MQQHIYWSYNMEAHHSKDRFRAIGNRGRSTLSEGLEVLLS